MSELHIRILSDSLETACARIKELEARDWTWPDMRPMSELPESGLVLVVYFDRSMDLDDARELRKVTHARLGWYPLPPSPVPPKPEQLTVRELGDRTEIGKIRAVEQRTREIDAWEQEHGE